ncbi:MAG: hypothetical protein AAF682_03845 [Planctomycetota bacterium]
MLFPRTTLALSCAALLAAAPPQEEPAKPTAWAFLAKKYDADGDGRITRKEYTRDDEHWKNLDVDGNGWIDEKEIEGRGWQKGKRAKVKPPAAGDAAPDFRLELLPPPFLAEKEKLKKPELVQLSGFKGKRPVALIFGSYT